jgi:hypothetical protein
MFVAATHEAFASLTDGLSLFWIAMLLQNVGDGKEEGNIEKRYKNVVSVVDLVCSLSCPNFAEGELHREFRQKCFSPKQMPWEPC